MFLNGLGGVNEDETRRIIKEKKTRQLRAATRSTELNVQSLLPQRAMRVSERAPLRGMGWFKNAPGMEWY